MKIPFLEVRHITAHGTPYLTKYRCTLLKGYYLHVFHREDADPDPHDHPWSFHTFPLVSYVEEVWEAGVVLKNIVSAGRWHYREATHTHRVLGSVWVPQGQQITNSWNVKMPRRYLKWYSRLAWWFFGEGKVVTIMKHGNEERKWGFRRRIKSGGKDVWVWVPWKEYVNKALSWME